MLTFFRNLVMGSGSYTPSGEDEFFLETRLPVWFETSHEPVDEGEYEKQLASWDAQHRAALERGLRHEGREHGTVPRPVDRPNCRPGD
jgi:hypothetical protein